MNKIITRKALYCSVVMSSNLCLLYTLVESDRTGTTEQEIVNLEEPFNFLTSSMRKSNVEVIWDSSI